MASRPILVVLGLVALLMLASWALGELLRQRKTGRRRPKRGS